ncbi:MAG: pentapeptide repeat-containing protein, partial [Candidatus Portiera sp.]|nr:pentapeptide repeat-containing protein [Portiera sp.]
ASEERRIDERFDNAVQSLSQKLNEDTYPDHMRAIRALQYMALNNPTYAQRCLDAICDCNQWMGNYLGKFAIDDKDSYVDRTLTEEKRIAKINEGSNDIITLHRERRSQEALKAVASILKKIGSYPSKNNLLAKLDFSDKMLCGINLSDAKIEWVNFNKAYLNNANLSSAGLQKASLGGSHLEGANLSSANMQEVDLSDANLSSVNLTGCSLSGAKMRGTNLSYLDMQGIDLMDADMEGAKLIQTQLQSADLNNANMQGVDLTEADLSGAELPDANLESANLSNSYLQGADFQGSNFKGANLKNAKMQGANLASVDLSEANLAGAKMHGVFLSNANLTNANLPDTLINGAILLGCDLSHVNLQNSTFTNILFDESTSRDHAGDYIEVIKKYPILGRLKEASIIESNEEEDWIIKPSEREGLKDFYRDIISEIMKNRKLSKLEVRGLMTGDDDYYYHTFDEIYPAISEELALIWEEIRDEAYKEKGVALR